MRSPSFTSSRKPPHIEEDKQQESVRKRMRGSVTTPTFQEPVERIDKYRVMGEQTQVTFKDIQRKKAKQMELQEGSTPARDKDKKSLTVRQDDTIRKSNIDVLLRKLDKAEEQLVRSEKNYAEMWRKQQKINERCQLYQKQLEECQLSRLRDHLQWQARIAQLEKQNAAVRESVQEKDNDIDLMRIHIQETDKLVQQYQKQIQQLKDSQQQQDQQDRKEKGQKTAQKMLSDLRYQLARFELKLHEKQQQKRNLLQQLDEQSKKYKQELADSKTILEQAYQELIATAQSQKQKSFQEYERLIQDNNALKLKVSAAKLAEEQYMMDYALLKASNSKLKEENTQLKEGQSKLNLVGEEHREECKILRREFQKSSNVKNQLTSKLAALKKEFAEYHAERVKWQQVNQQIIEQLTHSRNQVDQFAQRCNDISQQCLEFKNKCQFLAESSERLRKDRQTMAGEINKLKQQNQQLKQRNLKTEYHQGNIKNKLEDTVISLQRELQFLTNQREEIVNDLYAERLDNARLKDELRDTKEQLKREYDLSLQNTKRELEERIEEIIRERSGEDHMSEKEKLHLQIKELERKYELLASEVVTVDDVMKIAARVQKRHTVIKRT